MNHKIYSDKYGKADINIISTHTEYIEEVEFITRTNQNGMKLKLTKICCAFLLLLLLQKQIYCTFVACFPPRFIFFLFIVVSTD